MRFDGPVLLVAGPLVGALVTFLICGRRRVVAISGIIITWLLWAMVKAIPLSPTVVERATRLFSGDSLLVFGRSLLLTEDVQELALLLYLGTSILFLLSLLFPAGRYFVPGTLATLSFLVAAIMIEPSSFGALLLLLASSVLVMVIQGERAGNTRGAFRYLVMASLAVPAILVSGWMLSGEQTALLLTAARLLAGGSIILLAGFPFFFWVKPIVEETPPLVTVFLFGVFQSIITVFVFKLFSATPWPLEDSTARTTLYQSAAGTALVAGLLALVARTPVALLGYSLLLDMGMTVTAVAIGGARGWEVAAVLQIARYVSLMLAAVGLSVMHKSAGENRHFDGRGIARHAPLGSALFLFGCASLLGLPLTVGFGGRWALFAASEASQAPSWLPYALLLAMMGGTFGLLGSLARMLTQTKETMAVTVKGNRWRDGLSTLLLLAGIWLALFPHAAFRYVARLATLLQN